MNMYENSDLTSPLAAANFDERTHTAFFFIKNEGDVDRAREILRSAGQTVIAQSQVAGSIALITQGAHTKDALFLKLKSPDNHGFELVRPQKRTFMEFLNKEGWKIRGGLSFVGQGMTLVSSYTSVSERSLKAAAAEGKDVKLGVDPAMWAFASLNLLANVTNWAFGGQKEDDKAGMKKFDGLIADEINRYLPGQAQQISEGDVRKVSYMNDEERARHKKNYGPLSIIRKNSVRLGEVGLRTLGSVFLMWNYKRFVPTKFVKGSGLAFEAGSVWKPLAQGKFIEAFKVGKTQDPYTFLMGSGYVTGKMMGLAAQTYDPNNPPTTYWGEIRQKVLWRASSVTEMAAQFLGIYDRFHDKRMVFRKQGSAVSLAEVSALPRDYIGGLGNILVTAPYPVRIVLPYGEKLLDTDEVQARLLDELPKLPREKIPEVVARVSARIDEHMGKKSPGFAKLYADTMHKLESYKHIKLTNQEAASPNILPAVNDAAPKTTMPRTVIAAKERHHQKLESASANAVAR